MQDNRKAINSLSTNGHNIPPPPAIPSCPLFQHHIRFLQKSFEGEPMKGHIWIHSMVCVIAAAVLFGCAGGTKVVLKQENYVPTFRAADYSLFKGGEQKFQQDYTVALPTPSSQDPKELEKNAYLLIDQMVTAVFKDEEFRKIF